MFSLLLWIFINDHGWYSRPRANTTNRLPHIQKKAQPHDDDDILQFRRVSLLFWAGSVAAQTAHLSVDALTSPAFIFGNIEPFGSEHLSVDAFSSAALRAFTILEPWLAAQKWCAHLYYPVCANPFNNRNPVVQDTRSSSAW